MKKEIKDLLDAFLVKDKEVLEEIEKCEASLMDFSDLDEDAASECAFDIAQKIMEVLPKKVSLKYILAVVSTASATILDSFLDDHHEGAKGEEYVVFGKLMATEIFCKLLRTSTIHLIEQSVNE